ncbi:MAG TPA: acetyl-CoA hydrolase/transferase C-terminal domain-containing protein, partial [Xanthomonadales bacterium]|nr:acetyl-CoA hydrolase/transferase C-terminal domain-containing protein [Xanthomonadales bacterium]
MTAHTASSDPAIEEAVDRILAHCGSHIVAATPLALGKPNRLVNALYRRIEADPARSLELYTALSLARPRASNELERRFLEPFVARHFGPDYPDLDYVAALHAGRLPANIRVQEFYLQSGAWLGVPATQREYASINYTHVAREVARRGVEVVLQMVARRGDRLSLSCNPDLTLDLIDAVARLGRPKPLVVCVVHPDLPFLGRAADVPLEFADVLVEEPAPAHRLFALPAGAVDLPEYALGLHASALVRDGGTLQIGIGALSDAIVHALLMRERDNDAYRGALAALAPRGDAAALHPLVAEIGGTGRFERGLYGASEMVMDGFMHLRRAGILRRRVHPDLERQRRADAGEDVAGGDYLHGGFFLGTRALYEWLRTLEGEDYDGIDMTRVSHVNDLFGGNETMERAQRREARFFNTCMMHTLLGAAVSDALADGRVVSGVGGQYNFVAMAHALHDGRSVLLLRAVRESAGRVESNILWNYAHATIPRHLRDVVVTEYGVADLRGESDQDCIERMLAISDARFVDALADQAKSAGKLAPDYLVPDAVRGNTPEALRERLAPFAARGLLPRFPFGSDFDATELVLVEALTRLKRETSRRGGRFAPIVRALGATRPDPREREALARMQLDSPASLRDRLLARLVL